MIKYPIRSNFRMAMEKFYETVGTYSLEEALDILRPHLSLMEVLDANRRELNRRMQ